MQNQSTPRKVIMGRKYQCNILSNVYAIPIVADTCENLIEFLIEGSKIFPFTLKGESSFEEFHTCFTLTPEE